MKKFFGILLLASLVHSPGKAQDFVLNNPQIINPALPAPFPGMLSSVSFDFYVAGSAFTFSNSPVSNNYATITFSFTKLNPSAPISNPSGTGAALFTWTLTNNGLLGTIGGVYTWTGATKNVTMNPIPGSPKYHITFANSIITYAATAAQTDVRVAGQFTDPGNAPTGNSANNNSVIATYTTDAIPTPIKLLDFKATKQGQTAILNWSTTTELSANRFEIEHSRDGNQWLNIGSIAATGNGTGTIGYTFTHQTPVNGINYYRLRLVDNDGRYTYSPIRLVSFSAKGGISVLPNPVIDKVYITAGADVQIESVRLVNAKGQLLQQVTNFISGNSIDMSNYSAGTYILKVTDKQGNIEVKKLMKQSL